MPETPDGRPVVLVPGPQRDAYLEAMRQQLPLVARPPTNVAAAGTIAWANASGLMLRVPTAASAPRGAGRLHMVPPLASPGSTVRVLFVPTTHFLVAHGDRSLAPGSPILVMGATEGSTLRAILVTDLSGVREGSVSRPSAAGKFGRDAPVGASQPVAGRNAYLTADGGVDPSSQELVASGSWGWDGINAGINNVSWGSEDGCPYFKFVAQLAVGFGDEWHFPLRVGLDTSNRLVISADPAGVNTGGRPTFYSSFGGAAQLQMTLSCKIPLPSATIFGRKFGGGSIGPSFTFGPNYSMLMQNSTDHAAPLRNDPELQVPATSCFTLAVPDMIPGLGSVWGTIHAPDFEVPICPDISLQPTAFQATVHPPAGTPQSVALGDHQSAALGYNPPAGSTVRVDTFNFAPKAQVHLTAGVSLAWPKSTEGSSKNSGAPPLATARCKDGTYSFSQHARGTCSSHGGVAERLDPSSPSVSAPDPLWRQLVQGHLEAGPWTVPLVGFEPTLGTTWNPTAIDLAVAGSTMARPTLGQLAGLFAHATKGYGEVEPLQVNNGADPTGVVTNIIWKSWGGPQAAGKGVSDYERPGQAAAAGTEESVTIVAFKLGTCDGKRMYQAVEWYFPQHGQAFDPNRYENICTGTFVTGAPSSLSPTPSSSPAQGSRACAVNTPSMFSPLCPDGPTDTHFAPWQVVYFYYAYVNARDYPDAWALMSPGWQAAQGGYDRWKAGYAGANNGHVSETSHAGDIVNVKVTLPGQCFDGAYQVNRNKITTGHLNACP